MTIARGRWRGQGAGPTLRARAAAAAPRRSPTARESQHGPRPPRVPAWCLADERGALATARSRPKPCRELVPVLRWPDRPLQRTPSHPQPLHSVHIHLHHSRRLDFTHTHTTHIEHALTAPHATHTHWYLIGEYPFSNEAHRRESGASGDTLYTAIHHRRPRATSLRIL